MRERTRETASVREHTREENTYVTMHDNRMKEGIDGIYDITTMIKGKRNRWYIYDVTT
jgi:hypothetical protein